MRIVSLLPGATEIVCELGLGDHLVGVSHECDYPPFVQALPKVTRTMVDHSASSREIDTAVRERVAAQRALYDLDVPSLQSLQPDLIVTQELCNVCAVAESAVSAVVNSLPSSPRVVNLTPTRLADVLECLQIVGEAAGVPSQARTAVSRIEARIVAVSRRTESIVERPGIVLLEWIDPPFCAGHWSPELTALAGGVELIGKSGQPSRAIDWTEIVSSDPQVLVIACCGLDVERASADLSILAAYPSFDQLKCVRSHRVYLVNGSAYFNRPGPRLVESLEILAHTLHPDVHPLPSGLPAAQRVNCERLTRARSASLGR